MIKILPANLPKDLTSYDLLKALAIILMITDHVGHFFYPDEMWFRVVGRLCIPIWFFLIGYARGTEITKSLWIGGVIVAISAIIAGEFLLPLNILFTIIIFRYIRYSTAMRSFYSADGLRGMFLILLFLTLPSSILFEYGTSAMLFVLIGYMLRNRGTVQEKIELQYLKIFTGISFFTFFIIQGVSLPSLSGQQALFMLIGFSIIGYMLWNFKPAIYVDADRQMARSVIRILQFMGRRTLEIYVANIVIFRGVAMYLYPDEYGFMEWEYIPESFISMFM